ncbi:hypothetical protein ACQP1W_03875 [Spirillospora sp. CA-255316]
MTVPRVCILVTAAALAVPVAGCSGSDDPDAAPKAAPESSAASSASASPSAKPTSAFCLDLETFQVGVVAYRGGVGGAAGGERLDLKEMRRRADIVIAIGEKMRAGAPPDIAPQFTTVLEAIKTSSGKLKPGNKVRDVLDPVYGQRTRPAFDAVEKYECRGGG